MFRPLVSRGTATASLIWKTDRILRWSTVYTTELTPWSLLPEAMENGPRWRCVLRPADGGDGDDVLPLSVRNPPRPPRTRRHWEGRARHTGRRSTHTLISVRNLRTPMYARSTPALVLLLVTPEARSFPHPFSSSPLLHFAHLPTFNPLALARSLKRAFHSFLATLIRGRETVYSRGVALRTMMHL